MDIKKNSANIVSISRIFVAFVSLGLLFVNTTSAYIWAIVLAGIAFSMDAVDGYLARKFGQSSQLGAVLDIMGDRIVEAIFWVTFSALGWIPVIFPIICVTRAFVTDSIRTIATTGSIALATSPIFSVIMSFNKAVSSPLNKHFVLCHKNLL